MSVYRITVIRAGAKAVGVRYHLTINSAFLIMQGTPIDKAFRSRGIETPDRFVILAFFDYYRQFLKQFCVNKRPQWRHFNFFLGGPNFFLNFSMPPGYWKIGKNGTLYVVIWNVIHSSLLSIFFFLLFFSLFFSFLFSFFFFLGGRCPPQPPSNDAPERPPKNDRKQFNVFHVFMGDTLLSTKADS